ncbi:MAG: acyl-CoA dehydrogenase family protein [Acidimicrobiales bacterium]
MFEDRVGWAQARSRRRCGPPVASSPPDLRSSAHRALEHDASGFDRSTWARGAALGWTSLLVAEEHGGGCFSDHGLTDLVLVAEEMGRVVAPGPLVPVNNVGHCALSARLRRPSTC